MIPVSLPQLIDAARQGQVVSFPTDTVPALAAKPAQAGEIYRLKQRQQHKPLILMGARAADLWPYVRGSAEDLAAWHRLADQYWPGALTLVLPASGLHPAAMTPADPRSLGLRVPNHALALEILAATGPLATTSANRSGQPALVRLEDIAQQFPQVQVLSPSASGVEPHGQPSPAETQPQTPQPQTPQPSTIVAWQRQGWQVLRQGAIALSL